MSATATNLPKGLLPRAPGLPPLRNLSPLEFYRKRNVSDEEDWAQWPEQQGDSTENSGGFGAPGTATDATAAAGAPAAGDGGGGVQLCEPTYLLLRSKHSKYQAYVLFTNNTPYTVRTLWLSYHGHEVPYDSLRPGESSIQQTFATHPWIVREESTSTRLPINAQEAFCPHRQPPAQPRAPGLAQAPAGPVEEAPAAAAAAEAGEQPAAAADAANPAQAGAQQPHQQQQPPLRQHGREAGGWLVVDTPYGRVRLHESRVQTASITMLPQLQWSEEAHAHFPADFRAAVKAFLLCYQQLHSAASAALQGGAAAAITGAMHAASSSSGGSGSGSGSERSTHLGELPSVLLPHIISLAAPFHPQHLGLPRNLRLGIKPVVLPEVPPVGELPESPHAINNDDSDGDDDNDEFDDDDVMFDSEDEDGWQGMEVYGFEHVTDDEDADPFLNDAGEGEGDGEGSEDFMSVDEHGREEEPDAGSNGAAAGQQHGAAAGAGAGDAAS